MIHTNTTHSFGIDDKSEASMTGAKPVARGYCYPKTNWFSLTLGRNKEDTHLTWQQWDELVLKVQELRDIADKDVVLKGQNE